MQRFIVIENTPGYMPDDDEPFITDDYSEAVEYMNERAAEYRDDPDGNYRVVEGIASPNNYAAVMVYDDDKLYDLGRYIGVEIYEGDDDDDDDDPYEVVVGCANCGGYKYRGESLCSNCRLPAARVIDDVWVCADCYTAHHFGAHEDDGKWFAGEGDIPCDREPLALLADEELADNTDSNSGEGIAEFSWNRCEGCGSTLGGGRFRLAVFQRELRRV